MARLGEQGGQRDPCVQLRKESVVIPPQNRPSQRQAVPNWVQMQADFFVPMWHGCVDASQHSSRAGFFDWFKGTAFRSRGDIPYKEKNVDYLERPCVSDEGWREEGGGGWRNTPGFPRREENQLPPLFSSLRKQLP